MSQFPPPIVSILANGIVFVLNILSICIWGYATYRKPSCMAFWFMLLAIPLYIFVSALFLTTYLNPETVFAYIPKTLFFTLYTIGLTLMPIGSLMTILGSIFLIRAILEKNPNA